MTIAEIVSELKAERTRIDNAITALEGLSRNGAARAMREPASQRPKQRHLSAKGRRRISEMMKKRWAERRKKKAAANKK